MSGQVTITQLPAAGPLDGTESVPIVQNGLTVQTTTGAISSQPNQQQTFVTVDQETSLPNSRYLSVDTGLALTDGGSESFLKMSMTGTAASLNSASGGIIVKDSSNTVVSRSIEGGSGVSVSNADGTGANPLISLSGIVGSIENIGSGNGFIALNGTSAILRQMYGTTDQIDVSNGNGTDNPVISISDNPVLPGTGSVTVPIGNNSQRPSGSDGEIRFNTDTQVYEGYAAGAWNGFSLAGGVTTFSAGTTGFSPSSPTGGVVTLSGILNVSNGGTGATSLTGYVKGSGTSAFTANSTIPNTDITGLGTMSTQNSDNVAVTGGTINGTSIGGSNPSSATFTSLATTSGTISSTPVNSTDITNKSYVDSVAQGLNVKSAAMWGTTGNITLSGLGTQGNGEWTGTLVAGTRILVKSQLAPAENGIYVAASGAWSRSADANAWDELVSAFVFVQEGATLSDTGWVCTVDPGGTLGVTPVTWAQFSGAGTYTAGTGLTLTGGQFSITNTGVSAATYGSASQVPVFAVNAQGQLTSVTNTSIAISAGAVSGLAASATTDTTNASNITSGTLGTSRLSGSYTGITGVGTLAAGTWNGNTIGVGYGGTGLTATPTNGQLAIGNGAGYTLSTLTAGTNVSISNTAGGITISATPSYGGTVTSVDVSGGTTGLTFSGGPITTSGTITMAGTLGAGYGGTGATTLTGYVYGNGTGAMSASTTIPNTAITGLGTMATQSASSVAITGGAIDGTTVGATTAATVRGTSITATTDFNGPGTGLTGTASGLSIGGSAASATTATTATNANNVAIAASSTNSDYYLTLVSTNTGNLPEYVATGLTANPSTGKITGGISGGTF